MDRNFIKKFSQLVVSLMAIALAILFIAPQFSGHAQRKDGPQPNESLEVRLAPVSQNYIGAEGEAAVAAISAEIDQLNAATTTAAPDADAAASIQAAATAPAEEIDGGKIFNSVCFACHLAGVAGAPKLLKAVWEHRITKGKEQLVQHAIAGFQGDTGIMPAKGGRVDLTDAQIAATVQWMLDNLE